MDINNISALIDGNPKEALLKQLQSNDPELFQLYQSIESILDQQQARDEESSSRAEDDTALDDEQFVEHYNGLVDELEALEQRHEADQQIISDLQQQLSSQQMENNFLKGVLSQFARAAGACPKCAGQKPDCQLCDGLGVPGYLKPRKDVLRKMIRGHDE